MSFFGKLVTEEALPAHDKEVAIISPMSGEIVSLNEYPCDAFKQRLLGEGVAIEPAGFNCQAPFNAVIEYLPQTHHQIRLRARNGLRLLIQFGYGSEKLHGEGLKSAFKQGDTVKKGQTLVEYDIRRLKASLKSTLCPVTIINSNKLAGILPHYRRVESMQDALMTLFI